MLRRSACGMKRRVFCAAWAQPLVGANAATSAASAAVSHILAAALRIDPPCSSSLCLNLTRSGCALKCESRGLPGLRRCYASAVPSRCGCDIAARRRLSDSRARHGPGGKMTSGGDIAFLSAHELIELYRNKELSPVDRKSHTS